MLLPSRRNVAARMAAEQRKDCEKARKGADLDGRSWVRDTATRQQLKRLRKAVELSGRNQDGDASEFIGVANNGYNEGSRSALDVAFNGLRGGECGDAFYEGMFGEDFEERLDDQEYLIAFIDAALEEFAEIERLKPVA